MLQALAARSTPAAPPGPVAALTDRLLVHAAWTAQTRTIASHLPPGSSGLVLRGANDLTGCRELRDEGYDEVVLIDPESYRLAAATEEEPFILSDPKQNLLFVPTLDEVLQNQLDARATVALTPTGYLHAGDGPALKAAANAAAALDRDDVLFSVPLDVAWLTDEHIGLLLAVLSRLETPKAVFLGGQFDPLGRYKAARRNLRRLEAEAGHVAVLRTDLTGIDALCHGAFAASIGTGGSLRHIVPVDQKPISGQKDPSPSVLYGRLMSFFKGSKLAKRFANASNLPTCACAACAGRAINTFVGKDDTDAAHVHNILIWTEWITVLRGQATLADRAVQWRRYCNDAVDQCDVVNAELGQDGAFTAPPPLATWATLPAWPTPAPATPPARPTQPSMQPSPRSTRTP